MIYYSKITNGFYIKGLYTGDMPKDAITVTCEEHANILSWQAKGKVITSNESGKPIVVDKPKVEVSNEQLAAQARAKRDSLLRACDWTQVPDAPVSQADWASYRQKLRDITLQEKFPEDIDWPTSP